MGHDAQHERRQSEHKNFRIRKYSRSLSRASSQRSESANSERVVYKTIDAAGAEHDTEVRDSTSAKIGRLKRTLESEDEDDDRRQSRGRKARAAAAAEN